VLPLALVVAVSSPQAARARASSAVREAKVMLAA